MRIFLKKKKKKALVTLRREVEVEIVARTIGRTDSINVN